MPELKRNTLPSAKYLHQALDYFPDTGALCWKKRRPIWHFPDARAWKIWNTKFAGKVAGSIDDSGYVEVGIDDRLRKAHRVIWKMMEREDPPASIDHKDGDRANNRWANLRAATDPQQKWNERLRKTNTSGFKGVFRISSKKEKWFVQTCINGVRQYHGIFDTPEKASAVYQAIAREAHGEFYHPC